MNQLRLLLAISFIASCTATKKMHWPERSSDLTGSQFYHQAFAMKWNERDSFAVKNILNGDVPGFLKKFVGIHVSMIDSTTGKRIKATYYAAPDYLSVGTNRDWARINITPRAAQKIADTFDCFLPTKKNG